MIVNPDTYVFKFGQYAFHSYWEVFKTDPEYIRWCVENLAEFELDDYEVNRLEEKIKSDKVLK